MLNCSKPGGLAFGRFVGVFWKIFRRKNETSMETIVPRIEPTPLMVLVENERTTNELSIDDISPDEPMIGQTTGEIDSRHLQQRSTRRLMKWLTVHLAIERRNKTSSNNFNINTWKSIKKKRFSLALSSCTFASRIVLETSASFRVDRNNA